MRATICILFLNRSLCDWYVQHMAFLSFRGLRVGLHLRTVIVIMNETDSICIYGTRGTECNCAETRHTALSVLFLSVMKKVRRNNLTGNDLYHVHIAARE
jgi:hypothetical protein